MMKIIFTGGILSTGFMHNCTKKLQYFLDKECQEFKGQEIIIELVAKNFVIKEIIVTSPNDGYKECVQNMLAKNDIKFLS